MGSTKARGIIYNDYSMEKAPVVLTGYRELLDEFRKAKLKAGDLRGFKNPVSLAEKFGLNTMQVAFVVCGGNGKERMEVYAEITPKGYESSYWVYSMGELLADLKSTESTEFEIGFHVAKWNEHRTDADRKRLTSDFIFKKP